MEVVMVFIGGVQGAAWVPATKLLAVWFDDSSYATMFSALGCGSTMAGMLLPLVKDRYWRAVEMNLAFAVIIFSLVCKRWILTEDGLQKEVKPTEKSQLDAERKQGVTSIVKSSVIWHIALVYFFSMEMRTICETWVPLYLSEKNMSPDGFLFLYELGGLIGGMLSGVMLDKLAMTVGVDRSRKVLGVFFSVAMMLAAIAVFKYEELSSRLGFLTGFFVYGSINIWCLVGSQAGTSNIGGTVSAFISFIASMGSIFAGSPLAHLIHKFSFSVFTILFFTQIVFVISISSLRIPLRMDLVLATSEEEIKKNK